MAVDYDTFSSVLLVFHANRCSDSDSPVLTLPPYTALQYFVRSLRVEKKSTVEVTCRKQLLARVYGTNRRNAEFILVLSKRVC